MAVDFKDYYAVLGVGRAATDAEIKKAYRTLAGQYHPDVAKDKSAGEARFKDINEANEVLSDPEKRRKYDQLGADWDRPQRPAGEPGGQGGYAGFRSAPGSAGASDYHFEGTGFSDFFEQFFGSRGRAGGGFGGQPMEGMDREAIARQGQDIEGDILVSLGEVMHGSVRTIKMQRTDPRTGQVVSQTLQVKIPPGVRDGQLVRLPGQGHPGTAGGSAGHLYLRVRIAQHPDFRVKGADLYADLELAPWEAVLGATVDLATLDGTVSLTIPPGTTGGRQFRLRGKGLPTIGGPRGDLFTIVSIQVPAQVQADEKARWERLAAESTFRPRSTP